MAIKLKPGIVADVPVDQLEADPHQPRKTFNKESLAILGGTMKVRVLHPLIVRQTGKQTIIVDGERRYRAAKLSKIAKLPCLLADENTATNPLHLGAAQLTTAEQREALNPLDVAEFLVKLQKREKKSNNELLAALAHVGIRDMGPDKMQRLMRLVELPDWLKDGMRDGTYSEAHGFAALPAVGFPAVLKHAKANADQSMKWKGSVTVKEFAEDVQNAFSSTGIDLNADYPTDKVRHFPITVCAKCEFRKDIGKRQFCMAPKEFAKKNSEALELKLEKEAEKKARQVAKDKAAKKTGNLTPQMEVKAEQRQQSRKGKMREYLEAWLRPRVMERAQTMLDENAGYGIVIWLAAGAVDRHSGYYSGQMHEAAARNTDTLFLKRFKIANLPGMLEMSTSSLGKDHWNALTAAAVKTMTREQLRWFARDYLKLTLIGEGQWGLSYRIDEAYLRLKRKAEMLDLAKLAVVEEINGASVPAIKATLLEAGVSERIAVPADLQALYDEEIDQGKDDFDDLGDDDLDQGPLCIECGCTHMDPCEGGCGWVAKDGNVGLCTSCPALRWNSGDRSLSTEAQNRREERRAMMGDRDEDLDDDEQEELEEAAEQVVEPVAPKKKPGRKKKTAEAA